MPSILLVFNNMQSFINKAINKIKTSSTFLIKKRWALKNNIVFIPPDYWVVDVLKTQSIIIDIGLGDDANFSQNTIKKYKLKSFGFEPTKKHHSDLNKIESTYKNNFQYYKYAICHKKGKKMFYESIDNISGSLLNNHINIKKNKIRQYFVNTITLSDTIKLVNKPKIDLLKIDIEGEELLLIKSLKKKDLSKINQLVIEFHHNTVGNYTFKDTLNLIKIIGNMGFSIFTTDNVNFLFYRKDLL